jgi:lipopolysaccharide transport system permease protein
VSSYSSELSDLEVEIKPPGGWLPVNFRELWRFRELLLLFVGRDIKIRYKQTALGASWALIQPIANTFAFTVFFNRLAKIPSEHVPYSLFALSGVVLFSSFFSQALMQTAMSVVASGAVLTKIYFPRLLAPLATAAAYFVDLAIGLVLLLVVMAMYGYYPGVRSLLAPLFILLTFITAFGVGLWLAVLNVRYRDVRFVVPFLTQLWLLASPIAYPSTLLSSHWRVIYGINPMAGAIDGFRWSLLGTPAPPLAQLLISTVIAVSILVGGLFYFRRAEASFADIM